jgi:hypothetical protein
MARLGDTTATKEEKASQYPAQAKWDEGLIAKGFSIDAVAKGQTSRFEDSIFFPLLYVKGLGPGLQVIEDGVLLLYSVREGPRGADYRYFRPLPLDGSRDEERTYSQFNEHLEALIEQERPQSVTVFAVPDRRNVVKRLKVLRCKEYSQHIYDIGSTIGLKGRTFRSLRQKMNRFAQDVPRDLTVRDLHPDDEAIVTRVYHEWMANVKGGWRMETFGLDERIKTLFSLSSFLKKGIRAQLFYLDGSPISVHAAYEIGAGTGASLGHFMGICGKKEEGLSETVQMLFWNALLREGHEIVNDGPTWSEGLSRFKKKFGPIRTYRTYQGYYKRK